MKRLLLIFAAIALSLSSVEAQQDRRYSQGVFTETTTVTRYKVEKPVKEKTLYEIKSGYQQEVSLGWWWMPPTDHSALRLSYIGGYRLGNHLFAGVGAGLDVGILYTNKVYAYEDSYHDMYNFEGLYGYHDMPMQSVAIPLYANIKVYFTKTGVAPYLSFSAGARFSTPKKIKVYDTSGSMEQIIKYGAVMPFFEVATGINCRISDSNSFTFQFGYYTQRITRIESYNYGAGFYGSWSHGLACSIGITF